jgi:hypothetical protein
MNQYYPRYVDHNQTPPPIMTFAPKYGDKVEKPQARYWICTKCGYADRSQPVFTDKWGFDTDRHCQSCRTHTEHKVG